MELWGPCKYGYNLRLASSTTIDRGYFTPFATPCKSKSIRFFCPLGLCWLQVPAKTMVFSEMELQGSG